MNRFLFLIFLLSCIPSSAQDIKLGGLEFNSSDHLLNQRSSLTLTPDNKLSLEDNFTVSFEICFRETKYYGPIVSVISSEFESELLFIPNTKDEISKISLIFKKSSNRIDIPVNKNDLTSFKYAKVSINYDLLKREVKITWNKSTYITKLENVNHTVEANIFFGRIRHFGADTPKMNLREIKLFEKQKLKHYWKLNEVEGEIAHDSEGDLNAFAENPNWILSSSYHWTKIAEIGPFPTQKNISHSEVNCVFNSKSNQICLIYKDFLYSYNLLNREVIKEIFEKTRPHLYSDEVYNSLTDKLLSHYNGQGTVSQYNALKKEWSHVDTTGERELHYYGHNLFINPLNGDLMMMNGYGWHLTKNTLQKYEDKTRKWIKIVLKGDFISPRRDASMALIGDSGKLILFGGEGNESGKQEDGYRFLRDIFIIDLKDSTSKKVGEINSLSPNLMPLMSSHYDQKHNQLFVVMSDIVKTSKPKRLFRISLDNLKCEVVSDSVLGGDINWYNGIVFSDRTNKFYMISNGRKIEDGHYYDLYELNYPPITYTEYQQLSFTDRSRLTEYVIIIAALLLTTIGIVGVLIWKRKRRVIPYSSPIELTNKLTTNSIFLFGDFQIFDKNGKEITKEFTPKLKQLFLLLLFKSYNGISHGISIDALSTYLWPELDSEQTKNNRNVSLSKLRAILSQLDGIEIKNEKNTLELLLNETIYCDYLIFRKTVASETILPHLRIIKRILLRGELLRDVSYEWLDGIKIHFIEEIISKLKAVAAKNNLDAISKMELADSILLLDSVNEDGLSIKVKALVEKGDHQLAKFTFEHFKKEYKRLYAEEHKKSFAEYCN